MANIVDSIALPNQLSFEYEALSSLKHLDLVFEVWNSAYLGKKQRNNILMTWLESEPEQIKEIYLLCGFNSEFLRRVFSNFLVSYLSLNLKKSSLIT